MPEVLVITGPSGSGKTAVGFEVARQLAAADLPHAYIDTDHLDMVYPQPPLEELTRLSTRNLSAVWSSFSELGHTRLVLALTGADIPLVTHWLTDSIPDATLTFVRLKASIDSRHERLRTREIGSGLYDHIASSDRAAAYLRAHPTDEGVHLIETDGRTVIEIAREIIALMEWTEGRGT